MKGGGQTGQKTVGGGGDPAPRKLGFPQTNTQARAQDQADSQRANGGRTPPEALGHYRQMRCHCAGVEQHRHNRGAGGRLLAKAV